MYFYTEMIGLVFKSSLFYHILKDFLNAPVNLKCTLPIYVKTNIYNALVWFLTS